MNILFVLLLAPFVVSGIVWVAAKRIARRIDGRDSSILA